MISSADLLASHVVVKHLYLMEAAVSGLLGSFLFKELPLSELLLACLLLHAVLLLVKLSFFGLHLLVQVFLLFSKLS